jgi:hypothetical protein
MGDRPGRRADWVYISGTPRPHPSRPCSFILEWKTNGEPVWAECANAANRGGLCWAHAPCGRCGKIGARHHCLPPTSGICAERGGVW